MFWTLTAAPRASTGLLRTVRRSLSFAPPGFFRDSTPVLNEGQPTAARHSTDLPGFFSLLQDECQSLSPAAVARIAARAVRISVREGNSADAAIIISALREVNSTRAVQGVPIVYPIRQLSTAFVHSLIATGQIRIAARYARGALPEGERLFKTRTMTAIIAALCPTAPTGGTGPNETRRDNWISDSDLDRKPGGSPWTLSRNPCVPPDLQPKTGLDPSTRLAIALLAQARRTRYRRTNDMYKRVVDACLLQGEIVTATILLVILVCDCQMRARKLKQDDMNRPNGQAEAAMNAEARRASTARKRWIRALDLKESHLDAAHLRSSLLLKEFRLRLGNIAPAVDIPFPYPDGFLYPIIARTQEIEYRDPAAAEWVRGCLATLLAARILPYEKLHALVKFLYSAPPGGRNSSWPRRLEGDSKEDGPWSVYELCHSALLALIVDLPKRRTKYHGYRDSMLPPLNRRTYQGLFHYSLRHRLSTKMGSLVLDHMTQERKPPLAVSPDFLTVLIRYASILGLNGEVSKMIAGMATPKDAISEAFASLDRASPPREANFLFHWSTPSDRSPTETQASTDNRDVVERTEQVVERKLMGPMENLYRRAVADPLPRIDVSALDIGEFGEHQISIICTHFAATGRASMLIPLIPDIIPALKAGMFAASSEDERLAALHHAVTLGPYVFSAILNVCRKAGKTGLAERVWRYGLRVEYASWTAGPWGETGKGWWLNIESYTTMMQVYADEGRKGLGVFPGGSSAAAARRLYKPEKRYNKGWSLPVLRPRKSQLKRERWRAARSAGVYLLWRLTKADRLPQATDDIYQDPELVKRLGRRPVPDARFFNACLSLYGRKWGMVRRAEWRHERSYWTRKLRIKFDRMLPGSSAYHRDPLLPVILGYMRHLGYEVPLAFAHVESIKVRESAGHIPMEKFKLMHEQRKRIPRPVVYPPPKPWYAFTPFRLPVTKDRGLPIRMPPHRRKPRPAYLQLARRELLARLKEGEHVM